MNLLEVLGLRKKAHQHYEDGCLSFAVELDDGTVVCGMEEEVEE